MKLLEDLGKRQRNLIVQSKPKKIVKKKKNSSGSTYLLYNFIYFRFLCLSLLFLESKAITQGTLEDNDTMWTNFSLNLKEIIQMRELVIDTIEARPYDPVSEVPMDDQK